MISARIFFLLLILVFYPRLVPYALCESSAGTAVMLKKADTYRDSLYSSSSKMKYRHNWLKSIKRYENIFNKYPKSEEAPWAMYSAAKMYTRLHKYSGLESDLDTAIDLYGRITEEYNDHRLADDAQYKMGEIYYEYKKDMTQAYIEFLKVDILKLRDIYLISSSSVTEFCLYNYSTCSLIHKI